MNANRPNRGSVLVVDDEPGLRVLMAEELASAGFECTQATGIQARELLESRRFELVITDIAMPDVDGLALLAQIKRHTPSTKVVLVTGYSRREYLAQALMLGAFDYVQKPFEISELVELALRAVGDAAEIDPLAARAAESMEWRDRAREAALDSVRALVRAVEAKDPHTRRHSEQVTHYAVRLAGEMSLDPETTESVRIAALLHDVGKIGVPDHVLTKPGPLTEEEFDHIRQHPGLGADILANITLFGREAMFVRHHHERWDGGGYPDGLTGEETPLPARLIGVADAIDAMLMERTYKRGYSVEKVLSELERCAGTQFDPKVAAVAATWCRQHPDQLLRPHHTRDEVTLQAG